MCRLKRKQSELPFASQEDISKQDSKCLFSKGFLQKYLFSHKSFSISHCIFRSNARIWRISCKIGTARVSHALSQSCQSWCMIFIILNLKSTSRDCRSDLVDMIFLLPWKLPLWYGRPYLKSPFGQHFQSKLPICNVYILYNCKGLFLYYILPSWKNIRTNSNVGVIACHSRCSKIMGCQEYCHGIWFIFKFLGLDLEITKITKKKVPHFSILLESWFHRHHEFCWILVFAS